MYVNVENYHKQIFLFVIYATTEATIFNDNFVGDFNNYYSYGRKYDYKNEKQRAKVYEAY